MCTLDYLMINMNSPNISGSALTKCVAISNSRKYRLLLEIKQETQLARLCFAVLKDVGVFNECQFCVSLLFLRQCANGTWTGFIHDDYEIMIKQKINRLKEDAPL